MILFCPAVPPSPPSAPSLVPRNATSFVSLLAKLLVLRACLLLSFSAREKEKEERSSRERTHSSPFVPSTLSLFLLLSLFPSSGPPLEPLRSSRSCLLFSLSLYFSLSLSLSFPLRSVIAHGSLLGLTHFPPLPRRRRFFSVVLVFRAVVLFLFFPLVPLFSRGWFLFHPSSRRSVSLSLTATVTSTAQCLLLPFCVVLFCPCRSRCVLHSSNLNAGRAGVLYRLRK